MGKHHVPRLLLPLALDAQFRTPYPRSAGFDTDTYHTRSSRGVSAQRTVAMVHTQGEHLYLEIFSKGSSYKATFVLSKVRCIKYKHYMQSKYVT